MGRHVHLLAEPELTACRRKLVTILNARVKHHTPWQAQEGAIASQTRRPWTSKTVAPLLPRSGCWHGSPPAFGFPFALSLAAC